MKLKTLKEVAGGHGDLFDTYGTPKMHMLWFALYGGETTPTTVRIEGRKTLEMLAELVPGWVGLDHYSRIYMSQYMDKFHEHRWFASDDHRALFFLEEDEDMTVVMPPDSPLIDRLKEFALAAKKREVPAKRTLHIPVVKGGRIELKEFALPDEAAGDVMDTYNEDFAAVHATLVSRLSEPDGRGLAVLHGEPGTGKTSYIRHLCGALKDSGKRVVYVPQEMAKWLSTPEALPFLTEIPHSVLVIEDAEQVLKPRDSKEGGGSAVSTLLNLTDGLLADCLKVQAVCTFNAKVGQVDQALLRPGRLIARYEFGKLTRERASRLAGLRGVTDPRKECTLAELFAMAPVESEKRERKPIGFRTEAVQ